MSSEEKEIESVMSETVLELEQPITTQENGKEKEEEDSWEVQRKSYQTEIERLRSEMEKIIGASVVPPTQPTHVDPPEPSEEITPTKPKKKAVAKRPSRSKKTKTEDSLQPSNQRPVLRRMYMDDDDQIQYVDRARVVMDGPRTRKILFDDGLIQPKRKIRIDPGDPMMYDGVPYPYYQYEDEVLYATPRRPFQPIVQQPPIKRKKIIGHNQLRQVYR